MARELGKLTDAQVAKWEAVQKRLGTSQNLGEVRASDHGGGLVFSDDPTTASVPFIEVAFQSMKELKALVGMPDAFYAEYSDRLIKYPPALDPTRRDYLLSREHQCAMRALFTADEQVLIEEAATAYVLGNSKKVASWEDVLNAHFMPGMLTAYAGDTLIVDGPVTITGGRTVALNFKTVKIATPTGATDDATGSITIENTPVHFAAQQFIAGEGPTPPIVITGTPGTPGSNGAPGTNGNPGANGAPGVSGTSSKGVISCTTQPTAGVQGGIGNTGIQGGQGGNGPPVAGGTFNYTVISGAFTVTTTGSPGGPGGAGGAGGAGGNAGAPGTVATSCKAAAGAYGGNGGPGANGGGGGNGSDSPAVVVNYESLAPGTTLSGTPSGGPSGAGGSPGAGGAPGAPTNPPPGDGTQPGVQGGNGNQGPNGTNGNAIAIAFNQVS